MSAMAISSLLATAIVRRLLLEFDMTEEEDHVRLLGQPVAIWVTAPSSDFGGQSPAQVLASRGGEEAIGSWLTSRHR